MTDTEPEEPQAQQTLTWDANIDILLAGWCDNAKCFEWMHTESHNLYQKRFQQFMITTNCLTAIAGVSNVITGGIIIGSFQIAWVFGAISIFASTINIIQDKLGYQQSALTHKKLANEWSVIRSKIEEVVTLPYSGRRDCKTFLRYIKADINQATLEGNSIIPKHIRIECYNRFKTVQEFNIPDICGQVEHTKIYESQQSQSNPLKEPLLHLTI